MMSFLDRLFRSPPAWRATHRHRKGGLYRVTAEGVYEPTRAPVVIYDDPDGTIWVRPFKEFHDGRFTPLTRKDR